MTIRELRILPPLAIGRLGSADEPMDNYILEENPDQPLEFRHIQPTETLVVNEATGEITGTRVADRIIFKQNGRIRPVAPFLEVFAVIDGGKLVPLTTQLLRAAGLSLADLSWQVTAGNRKVERRTNHPADRVEAKTGWFKHHRREKLKGRCQNFVRGKVLEFGHVQYIKPNARFPEIRLRFTPAAGLIYGPSQKNGKTPGKKKDGLFVVPRDRAIYDVTKGWVGFTVPLGIDNADPKYKGKFYDETYPSSLFAIDPPAPCWLHGNFAKSRGYLDDACDGVVRVRLERKGSEPLEAMARFCAAPPAVVPDSLFIRTLGDELDQIIHGPGVPKDETAEETQARALEIIHRAFETVRFLNVAVMNGNPFKGRDPLTIDTMPAEEAFDIQRLMRPIVPEKTADTLAILALHQQVYTALRAGAAPWFAHVLRDPRHVADFTDHGRRKMPAMMCGADGSYLALTHRQINAIVRAAGAAPTAPGTNKPVRAKAARTDKLTPRNLTAQLHYIAAGNPVCSRPVTSIGNCTPGLEVDFRAVWRRLFEGIVLREWDNLVVAMDPNIHVPGLPDLAGHRLLRVNEVPMITTIIGPSPADPANQSVVLATDDNPAGVAPLEWSNALAGILHECKNQEVTCDFTARPVWLHQQPWTGEKEDYITLKLKMREVFEPGTAVVAETLAEPGELTQGLCSPWQNDYRECSCYYWASARPDFVNVEPGADGRSAGDNWLQKKRTGDYVPDDYVDSRLVLYDDLFKHWEAYLRFQVGGRDATASAPAPIPAVAKKS